MLSLKMMIDFPEKISNLPEGEKRGFI